MTKVSFHTNINCASCKANVEKVFDGRNMYNDFQVNFNDPQKTATFNLREGVNVMEVQRLIKEAGYKAEVVDETNFLKRLFGRK